MDACLQNISKHVKGTHVKGTVEWCTAQPWPTIGLDHVQIEDDVKYAVLLLDITVVLQVVSLVLDVLGESLCILAFAGLHQDVQEEALLEDI